MAPSAGPSTRRALVYVGAGLFVGLCYAQLNTQTDAWARSEIGRVFAAFHAFVDRGIPLLAGGLAGLAFHWLHLRTQLARTEALRSAELRSRLQHVERDQAAWVVAASALHELKNPLHTLGLLVDELAHAVQARDHEAAEDELSRLRKQLDRALVPLEGLRTLTRQSRATQTTQDIGTTVANVVSALRPFASDAGIELRFEGDRHALTATNAELLRIILDNLVANALEGDKSGARPHLIVVTLTEEPDHERVVLRVSDDGPGLPDAVVADLFEPLRTEKSTGLGLGLPIARALARTLGGDLMLVAQPSFTTTFELTLPIERSPRP